MRQIKSKLQIIKYVVFSIISLVSIYECISFILQYKDYGISKVASNLAENTFRVVVTFSVVQFVLMLVKEYYNTYKKEEERAIKSIFFWVSVEIQFSLMMLVLRGVEGVGFISKSINDATSRTKMLFLAIVESLLSYHRVIVIVATIIIILLFIFDLGKKIFDEKNKFCDIFFVRIGLSILIVTFFYFLVVKLTDSIANMGGIVALLAVVICMPGICGTIMSVYFGVFLYENGKAKIKIPKFDPKVNNKREYIFLSVILAVTIYLFISGKVTAWKDVMGELYSSNYQEINESYNKFSNTAFLFYFFMTFCVSVIIEQIFKIGKSFFENRLIKQFVVLLMTFDVQAIGVSTFLAGKASSTYSQSIWKMIDYVGDKPTDWFEMAVADPLREQSKTLAIVAEIIFMLAIFLLILALVATLLLMASSTFLSFLLFFSAVSFMSFFLYSLCDYVVVAMGAVGVGITGLISINAIVDKLASAVIDRMMPFDIRELINEFLKTIKKEELK